MDKETREETAKEEHEYKMQENWKEPDGRIWEIKQDSAEQIAGMFVAGQCRRKRRKRIRTAVIGIVGLMMVAVLGLGLYKLDENIPSVIRLRAGQEQSFTLGVPAKARIIEAGEQDASNIPAEKMQMDLSRKITVRAGEKGDYKLQVNLFGWLPFKQVGIQTVSEQTVIPVGMPIGLYVKTKGVLVIGLGEFYNPGGNLVCPAEDILKSGDMILECNGQKVETKDQLTAMIEDCEGNTLWLKVHRQGKEMELEVDPQKDETGIYHLGVWIRDNAQGVGTLTYIDSQGGFGALGHGITDVDTGTIMEANGGAIYRTEIVQIRKGEIGSPGEMTGMIYYSEGNVLGEITGNDSCGIHGFSNESALKLTDREPVPVGMKQDIELGPGQILCCVDGEARCYDVRITQIRLDHDQINRGIELKVTDPELLEITGGIIQGMSGSPILQNGKLIGAVTHVLIDDPTRGYGIFIENMLEH